MPMRIKHSDTFQPGLTKGGPGSGPHPHAGEKGSGKHDTKGKELTAAAKKAGFPEEHAESGDKEKFNAAVNAHDAAESYHAEAAQVAAGRGDKAAARYHENKSEWHNEARGGAVPTK